MFSAAVLFPAMVFTVAVAFLVGRSEWGSGFGLVVQEGQKLSPDYWRRAAALAEAAPDERVEEPVVEEVTPPWMWSANDIRPAFQVMASVPRTESTQWALAAPAAAGTEA
jgi:hypothetical protein